MELAVVGSVAVDERGQIRRDISRLAVALVELAPGADVVFRRRLGGGDTQVVAQQFHGLGASLRCSHHRHGVQTALGAREKLLEYSPDLVLVAINYSDINDMILRGGQARFRPDGSVEMARRPPAWEWLYGVSFIARHIVHDVLHYNRLLRHRSEVPALERDAGAEIVKAIDAFRRMAHERHFRFVVVVHPHADESHSGAYIGPLEAAVAGIRRMDDVGLVDVLHAWRSSGVVTAKNYQSFFWPLDFHNNANGYAIFGAAVAEGLRGLGLPTP